MGWLNVIMRWDNVSLDATVVKCEIQSTHGMNIKTYTHVQMLMYIASQKTSDMQASKQAFISDHVH